MDFNLEKNNSNKLPFLIITLFVINCKIILMLFFFFQCYFFTAEDLKEIEEIGRGNHGAVVRMIHIPSQKIMAVKVRVFSYL